MTKKEFIKKAIKNGYTGSQCKGWEWIKENLKELDYIFNTAEYKDCKGMKHLCMPFLIGDDELSELEEKVLTTAWYLNNDRVHDNAKEVHKQKMLSDGYTALNKEIIDKALAENKKLFVDAEAHIGWARIEFKEIYKPVVYHKGTDKEIYGLRKPRMRTHFYYLSQFENAFCKLIN